MSTFQVFYTWERDDSLVKGVYETEAQSPRLAVHQTRQNSEKVINVTGILVRRRGGWEQVAITPEILTHPKG